MESSTLSVLSIDMIATGRRIAQAREKVGISVRDLQDVLGLGAPTAIYKWQRGECLPKLDHLIILSAILGVPMDELLVVKNSDI